MADAMAGGNGYSPRKAMAMGKSDGGSFGVEPGLATSGRRMSPDHTAGTGLKGAMDDGDRGVGHPIHHSPGMQPAQAAPIHGPHFEKEMGFDRGGKA